MNMGEYMVVKKVECCYNCLYGDFYPDYSCSEFICNEGKNTWVDGICELYKPEE